MVEGGRVVPSLEERGENVDNSRTPDLHHCVVPGRPRTVAMIHPLALGVSGMRRIVSAAVTEIDASNEGDVSLWPPIVADDDHLLMMGSAAAHALVEQRLAAGLVDLRTQSLVLLGAEGQAVPWCRPH